MNSKFLIIAGTEKAGTTSLFQYLTDTGIFNVSKKKETDYLRGSNVSVESYVKEFNSPDHTFSSLYLEASPGYLADSHIVSQNIKKLDFDSELVFLLRSPMKRLISSFSFHKSRLYIPKSLDFNEYVSQCFRYESGDSPEELLVEEWFLRVLNAGLYFKHISDFDVEQEDKIHTFAFEEFIKSPRECVQGLISIFDDNCILRSDYDFHISNETQGYKFSSLQYLALKFNKFSESFFYKYPLIKRIMKNIYTKVNGAKKESVDVSKETKKRLKSYYMDDICKLADCGYITEDIKNKWINDFEY